MIYDEVKFIESIDKNKVSIIIECSIKSVNKKYRYISESIDWGMIN